ncbi:MAG: TolC family protein [Tannerella sp.]|jgi:outer membrane protein TolC|nr:TolC family protein [Tannerella sp.]
MKPFVFIICILFSAQAVFAQEKSWSLEDCIEYAIAHNPQRAKQEAQNAIYKINREETVAGFLPSLSAETSLSGNFGRGVDPETNTYISTSTLGNSYQIYSSLTLFDGLSSVYRAKAAKINQLMGDRQLQEVKDQIALETMEIFYNALYYKGTVALAEQQLRESSDNLKRFQRMEELGMKAAPDVAEIRAKEAEDRFLLTRQRNLLRLEIIKLKEKMNFPADEDLQISGGEDGNQISPANINLHQQQLTLTDNPAEIFEQALLSLPKIIASEQALKTSELEYKAARGRLFPTIALGAGFSTGFSRLMDDSPYMSFKEQLKNRRGSYLGVSLSIPLFDKLSRSSESRRAKQRFIIAQNQQQETLRQAYSEIEQAVADVNGLREESAAAHEKTVAMNEAHRVNERKYDEGLISAIELTTSANRLLNARVEELYSGLKYQLKYKLLNYYKGISSWTEF